mgnify:FL=1
MNQFSRHSSIVSEPLLLDRTALASVYGLFAVALLLTFVGVYAGMTFAQFIITSGWMFLLLFVELGIILTAGFWSTRTPLNYVLFAVFPLFSGLSITPFILSVLQGYVNGAAILQNALISTTLLAAAAALFAYTTTWNLGLMGRFLFFAVLGLLIFGLLQIFLPSFRTTQMEMMVSAAGIVIFSLFTAYDVQRITQQARAGASPFLLALSLYLDIYNLFLFVLRFMLAFGGRRE